MTTIGKIKSVMKWAGCGAVLLVAFLIVVLSLEFAAGVTTRLGRLHGRIEIGASVDDAWESISQYCQAKQGSETHCSRSVAGPNENPYLVRCDTAAAVAEVIHVWEPGLTDDRQLYVFIDDSGMVCGTKFWAD